MNQERLRFIIRDILVAWFMPPKFSFCFSFVRFHVSNAMGLVFVSLTKERIWVTLRWNTQYVRPKKKGECLDGSGKGKWYITYDESCHFFFLLWSLGRLLELIDCHVVKFVVGHEMTQVPEFEEAAFSAPLNKVVRCKTKFGWHLLQVLSERYILDVILLSFLIRYFRVFFLICISCYQGRIDASGHPA